MNGKKARRIARQANQSDLTPQGTSYKEPADPFANTIHWDTQSSYRLLNLLAANPEFAASLGKALARGELPELRRLIGKALGNPAAKRRRTRQRRRH